MEKQKFHFSLVEPIVVIATMAVMTSVLAPSISAYVMRTRLHDCVSELESKYAMKVVYDDYIAYPDYTSEEFHGVFEDANGNKYIVQFKRADDIKNGYFTYTEPVLLSDYYDNTTEPDFNETIFNVPEGYKFVIWADEEKTSYVIEDAEGNQQVIIIEKN